jgi:hypothetical protein
MFLRSVAFLSVAELSYQGARSYGRQEINRGVFKVDKVEPKPGKLWERTKHWTIEDATLSGGALGMFMAMNPRALPGAFGFSRFFGAATVGCAMGYKIGQAVLVRFPPEVLYVFDSADTTIRHKEYQKLLQNNEAKASLSRVGRLALSFYTSPFLNILRSPLMPGGMDGMGGMTGGQDGPPGVRPLDQLQAEMQEATLIQVEFRDGELAGPDLEKGRREYKDDIKSRDASNIQDWLERLQELKKKAGIELQILWRHLAEREREFYKLEEQGREKDIFSWELQILNFLASDLVNRHAIFTYHESDARKRLQQIKHTDSVATTVYETPHHTAASSEQEAHYGLHSTAERVRWGWSRKKELLVYVEHELRQYEALQPGEGTPHAKAGKAMKQEEEKLRLNIAATERVLRWLEQQMREADEQVRR